MLDTPTPIPLDFLANGAFLTTSIDDYLAREGLSAESTLTLQYVRSLLPPSYEASFEHDDWVGAVDCLSATSAAGRVADGGGAVRERVASASYDGLVRAAQAVPVVGAVLAAHLGLLVRADRRGSRRRTYLANRTGAHLVTGSGGDLGHTFRHSCPP